MLILNVAGQAIRSGRHLVITGGAGDGPVGIGMAGGALRSGQGWSSRADMAGHAMSGPVGRAGDAESPGTRMRPRFLTGVAIQALLLGVAGVAALGVGASGLAVGAEGPAGVVGGWFLALMTGVAIVAALHGVAGVAAGLDGGLREVLAMGLEPEGGVRSGLGAADVRVDVAGGAVGPLGHVFGLVTGDAGVHSREHFVAGDTHLVVDGVAGEALDLGRRVGHVGELDVGQKDLVLAHRRGVIGVRVAHRALVGALGHVGLVGVAGGAGVHRGEGHEGGIARRRVVAGVTGEAEFLHLELVVDDDAVGAGRRFRALREGEGDRDQGEARDGEKAR